MIARETKKYLNQTIKSINKRVGKANRACGKTNLILSIFMTGVFWRQIKEYVEYSIELFSIEDCNKLFKELWEEYTGGDES